MENKFAEISTTGECKVWKLPIPRRVYDACVIRMKELAQNNDGERALFLLTELLNELGCKEIVNAF